MYEIAEHFCWQISLRAGRPQGPPLRQDHRFYNSGAFLQHALFSLFSVDILTASLYNYIAIFEDTPSLASMYKLRKRSF
jgi:hypothetical protein